MFKYFGTEQQLKDLGFIECLGNSCELIIDGDSIIVEHQQSAIHIYCPFYDLSNEALKKLIDMYNSGLIVWEDKK